MKDIDIGKRLLEEENLSIVVVKDGKLVYKSRDRGIKPMYIMATDLKKEGHQASIADKIMGKGAAELAVYIGVKEVFADLISQPAYDVFTKAGIPFSYREICRNIKNRDKTGLCPVEKVAKDSYNIEELLNGIKEFLLKIGLI